MNITTIFQIVDYNFDSLNISDYSQYQNMTESVPMTDGYKVFFIFDTNVCGIFDKHTSEVVYIYTPEAIWYSEYYGENENHPRVTEEEILEKINSIIGRKPDVYFPIEGLDNEQLAVIDSESAKLDISRNSYLIKIVKETTYKILEEEK